MSSAIKTAAAAVAAKEGALASAFSDADFAAARTAVADLADTIASYRDALATFRRPVSEPRKANIQQSPGVDLWTTIKKAVAEKKSAIDAKLAILDIANAQFAARDLEGVLLAYTDFVQSLSTRIPESP